MPANRGNLGPRAAWTAVTTLTYLKPRLKHALLPASSYLAHHGITANQVTVASLLGSILVGAVLTLTADRHAYLLLPLWLIVRTALAAIDGTLAIEFGQKSRLGGFLNEAGDILSEIALAAPLIQVASSRPHWVVILFFVGVVEIVGIMSAAMGADRRCEGPFGKTDRAVAWGAIGLWVAACGAPPALFTALAPVFDLLLLVTVVNRMRFARAAYERRVLQPHASLEGQIPGDQ